MSVSSKLVIAMLATILVTMLASGCAALVVGGAAAGGYATGKDDRTASGTSDDGAISATIMRKLTGSRYVSASSVNVKTRGGVVTLNGTVNSHVARAQAERLAMDTNGVKSVINNLEVTPVAGS